MESALKVLTVAILAQTCQCDSVRIESHQPHKGLTSTTVDLLSSFNNCMVYIYDWALKNDCKSSTSTEYFKLYSESINCALIVDTATKFRNKSVADPRFGILEPHPLFTKFTTILINLYSPATTSTTLKFTFQADGFCSAIFWYNVPFNYVLIFMSNEVFSSIDSVRLFSRFVTISTPAVYMLILDEREVNVIGFAHALQSHPFLFKVAKLKDAYIRQLYQTIHKDLQGAIARVRVLDSWETCTFGTLVETHPHMCTLGIIAENFNLTFLNWNDNPFTKPSISEVIIKHSIGAYMWPRLSRRHRLNFDLASNAIQYDEFNFLCIAEVSTIGLMAFFQAYDTLTWIATAAACLWLSATIAAMVEKTATSFWTKLQSAAPVVLMLLIERFYGYGQVVRFASRQIGLVITLWEFGAMLLGMGYSGNMVSLLTSPSLPSCPHNMKELAEKREYPILTNSLQEVAGGMLTPFFHKQIDDYLAYYANRNGSLVSVLQQFRNTLKYVNYSVDLVPTSHSASSKILSAYVGPAEHVSAHGMWTAMHNKNIRVLRGGSLPFFNTWAPIFVQTNFLSPIFRRFLSQFLQCGIWKYWVDSNDAVYANARFQRLVKTRETGSREIWFRRSDLAAIWRNSNPSIDNDPSWNAMTLENLNAAFSFLGIFFLLALFALIKERLLLHCIVHVLLRSITKFWIGMNRILQDFGERIRKS